MQILNLIDAINVSFYGPFGVRRSSDGRIAIIRNQTKLNAPLLWVHRHECAYLRSTNSANERERQQKSASRIQLFRVSLPKKTKSLNSLSVAPFLHFSLLFAFIYFNFARAIVEPLPLSQSPKSTVTIDNTYSRAMAYRRRVLFWSQCIRILQEKRQIFKKNSVNLVCEFFWC